MKKFILFAFLISMMGSSFNEGARADCPPGCTGLHVNYDGRSKDEHTVRMDYRECGGSWKLAGVFGSGMGTYDYCLKPGVDDISVLNFGDPAKGPVFVLPKGAQPIPKEGEKTKDIYIWCGPNSNGPRSIACQWH